MPKDTTFTAADIIRLFCNNLDKEERKQVALFFLVIYPGLLLTNNEVAAILAGLRAWIPSWLFKNVLSLFMIVIGEIRTFLNKSWANIIFDTDVKKEVIRCIDERLKQSPEDEALQELLGTTLLLKGGATVLLRGGNVLSTGRVLLLNQ